MCFETCNAMRSNINILNWILFLAACASGSQVQGQERSVSMNIVIARTEKVNLKSPVNKIPDASNVAVWLTPLERTETNTRSQARGEKRPRLVQRNKTFEPHILIVPVGTMVEFPNKDPFFHNIFSLYDGKRFDLGLYEAGTTRSVLFDRPGVSFLFCNIHAEMSAVVIAVDTPYFGLSDRSGSVVISGITDGRYQMNIWYERSSPEELKALTRVVTVSDSVGQLPQIRIQQNPNFTTSHKNKYGLDYVPPAKNTYGTP
jgi:plastocyanin